MDSFDIGKLKSELEACKMAHIAAENKEIKRKNQVKLDILEAIKGEFPFITYDYTTNKHGYITFFIGKKQIFLQTYSFEPNYIWLRTPKLGFFNKVKYGYSEKIRSKADLGKILTPLLEAEILGERSSEII